MYVHVMYVVTDDQVFTNKTLNLCNRFCLAVINITFVFLVLSNIPEENEGNIVN